MRDRVADRVVAAIGSWTFIFAMTGVLVAWVVLNVVSLVRQWDPSPFQMLTLVLSIQASYAAPLIIVAERRSTQALQLKLDELIRAMPEARDEMIAAEKLPKKVIDRLRDEESPPPEGCSDP